MGFEAMGLTWLLGLISGMRHAFEPDHLAAMSTVVTEGRSTRRAAWLGACWGLGHTAALLGAALAIGVLRSELSSATENVLELLVALMLLVLGIRAIRRGIAETNGGSDAWHTHRGRHHRHHATGTHVHLGLQALSPRSFAVGVVHGLAGSGALVALAMTRFPNVPTQLLYVALFGTGSVAAMAAVSGLVGWQIAQWSTRSDAHGWLQIAAGALSFGVGTLWAAGTLAAAI